eukprot:1149389-Pelagomonas_calceolata.AAC.5
MVCNNGFQTGLPSNFDAPSFAAVVLLSSSNTCARMCMLQLKTHCHALSVSFVMHFCAYGCLPTCRPASKPFFSPFHANHRTHSRQAARPPSTPRSPSLAGLIARGAAPRPPGRLHATSGNSTQRKALACYISYLG